MERVPRRRSALVARLLADGAAAEGAGERPAVADEVRRVILDGGAPPGTPIPVGEVAELFGVSAIPVREALKTLVGEGLVAHRPNAGYVVAQLTRGELREIYVVRGVLESAALRASAEVAGPGDVDRAAAAHRALEDAIARGDHRGYHRQSRAFHVALIAPCRMQRLLHMFESAWNVTEPFQPMRFVAPGERSLLHAEHGRMLEAFAARDGERLVEVSAAHHERLESVIGAMPEHAGLLHD